ncbi:protein kinase, partial [Oryctes borbonicus]
YENNKNIIWLTPLSFKVIMQVCLVKGRCQEWLQNNYEDLQPFYEQARTAFFQNKMSDEKTYKKMKKFEVLMNLLISGEKICKKIIYNRNVIIQRNISEKLKEECLLDGKINSRKAKRRTKALKAKIAKFKTAELTERLNNSSKKLPESRETEAFSFKDEIGSPSLYEEALDFNVSNNNIMIIKEDECDIVNSIKKKLLIGLESESELLFEKTEQKCSYARLDWRNKILSMAFNVKPKVHVNNVDSYEEDFHLKPDDLNIFNSDTNSAAELRRESLEALLYPSMKYLNVLLNKIIDRYQKYWMIDYQLEKEVEDNNNDNKIKPEECIEQTKILQKLEKEKIEILRRKFDDIIVFIKETAAKDMQQSRQIIKKVENILLSHEIRGTTIISEVCPAETIYVSITMPENVELPNPNGPKNALIQYMEDVLNDRQEPIDNINITVTKPQIKAKTKNYISDDILYMKEVAVLPMAKPVDTKCTTEAQKRTLKHAYHIQTSILNVCEETEGQNEKSKDMNVDYKRISKTMMFFNKNVYPNRPELTFTDTFVDPLKKSENEGETSRWCTLVRSLEMMEDCQEFLNGTVRISCKEKRQSHVISTGGNFTPVELGLDSCNRPLAVKRIPKGSCVCEMIRSMLVDLIELRHKNLLHYFACDYDTNELIIATPLCEYNVGQYLMLMKQNQTNLSALDVVKQFLTGLLFLHDRVDPIVHGNLKPSNIFIDMNGVVKIAEFGIHRALFKFKEAPNSSIIWFATETYRTFKQLSIMECTCASDIQVAGMSLFYIRCLIIQIVTLKRYACTFSDDCREASLRGRHENNFKEFR